MLFLGILLSVLCFPGAIHAESAYDPIVSHLEFLGYQSDAVEQGIRARHRTKIHLIVSYSKGGILLQTGFPGKGTVNEDSKRFTVINNFNSRTQVARAFWTTDGHLFMAAWAPGLYDKLRFAQLLEAWEKDAELLREVAIDLKTFLQD